jgi:hypothetical protein
LLYPQIHPTLNIPQHIYDSLVITSNGTVSSQSKSKSKELIKLNSPNIATLAMITFFTRQLLLANSSSKSNPEHQALFNILSDSKLSQIKLNKIKDNLLKFISQDLKHLLPFCTVKYRGPYDFLSPQQFALHLFLIEP